MNPYFLILAVVVVLGVILVASARIRHRLVRQIVAVLTGATCGFLCDLLNGGGPDGGGMIVVFPIAFLLISNLLSPRITQPERPARQPATSND
jgi:hypothetical protein